MAVGFCMYQFGKAWVVPILGAWGGIVLVVFLLKLAGVTNSIVGLIGAVVGAIGGGYLGKMFNKHVKVAVTGVVGAFFITRGAGTYIGGFPSDYGASASDLKKLGKNMTSGSKYSVYIWAYLVAFIVLAIAGICVQAYVFKKDGEDSEDEDDYMKNEEENDTCGCF